MSDERLPIYLDHNATTPVLPEVVEAMLVFLRDDFGNPSSGHVYGQRAKRAVEVAREQVASLLGCDADEIVFTSGGTEANNLAIRGVLSASRRRGLLTSVVEHPATLQPCAHLERRGHPLERVGVDAQGQVELAAVRERLSDETALVSLMLAQNETGALMPITRLAEAAHAVGALMHTDAAQAVGKMRTRVGELGVDLLSIAGHKLYAPKGVGALYLRRGVQLEPVLRGAGHERGVRPGTENVPYIVGLGLACALAERDLESEAPRQRELSAQLWRELSARVSGLRRNSPARACLPNTLNLSFPGVSGSAVLARAPEVAASTGSACHAGHEQPSAVLLAMGLSPEEALGAVRLSLGRSTTEAEVREAAAALGRAFADARG